MTNGLDYRESPDNARIYEVLPLVCPKCGGEMKIIAFITEPRVIREILADTIPDTIPFCPPARMIESPAFRARLVVAFKYSGVFQ